MSVGWIVFIILLIVAGVGVWYIKRKPSPLPDLDETMQDSDTAWNDPVDPDTPRPSADHGEPRP